MQPTPTNLQALVGDGSQWKVGKGRRKEIRTRYLERVVTALKRLHAPTRELCLLIMKHAQAIGCGDSRYTVGCWVRQHRLSDWPTAKIPAPSSQSAVHSPQSTTHNPHLHPGPTRSKRSSSSSVGIWSLSTWLVQCDRYCSISNHPRPLIGLPGNLHLIPGLVGGF
ncbi:hypothetical protein NA56DRAFT_218610 [Hyaloscypha hepaticicola]|uniref:Uncharacterized protein n=1 Tax=Hyaloscypha hepaticicola TaxID=2082293 RepID=A0A2J6PXJ6_9HELO|nr:hypothetical protein NA56DRAFT_218610 [Hyaloscypha hepaticicola]